MHQLVNKTLIASRCTVQLRELSNLCLFILTFVLFSFIFSRLHFTLYKYISIYMSPRDNVPQCSEIIYIYIYNWPA